MNRPRSFEEVQTYLNQLESRLAKLESRDIDLHQRKIVNAADAVDDQDYVTLAQLKTVLGINTSSAPSPSNSIWNYIVRGLNKAITFITPSATTFGRIYQPIADTLVVSLNASFDGANFIQDDTSKASWIFEFFTTGCYLRTIPAGGAIANLVSFTPTTMGFFSNAAVAQQTLSAYTTDTESVAYTGQTNAIVGSVYAKVADLNSLRVAYENLRLAHDDLRTKIQTSTLIA